MEAVPYADRLPRIRDELVMCAEFGKTTSYTQLGRLVGIPTRGPWRGVLDLLSQEEIAEGRPDITHLVINLRTGISGRVEYKDARKPTPEQCARSREIQQDAFAYYGTRQ